MNKLLNKYAIMEQLLNNNEINDGISRNINKFIVTSNKDFNDIDQVLTNYVKTIIKPSKYYDEKIVLLYKILTDILNNDTNNFVCDYEDFELICKMEESSDDTLWCKNKYKDGYILLNAILNKIKAKDSKNCCKCINALKEKDNAIDIIELLDNAIKVNNGEELKILFSDNENLVPINSGIPIGAYAFGDKFKSFLSNTKKKVKNAVNNIGDGLKKAKDDVVKIANQVGNKIIQAYKGSVIEDAVQKTGKLVGKAYDGLKEVKDNFDGKVKDTATKFVEKYSEDNFFGKLADDIANYDKNNDDIDKIKDSHYFSAYKGKKVIKDKLIDGINDNVIPTINKAIEKTNKALNSNINKINTDIGSTFGIGDVIVLGQEAGKSGGNFSMKEYENDIKHEYGHTKQYDNLGPIKFIKDIAIPSMKGYTKSMSDSDYYSQPWERGADELGGVKRNYNYKQGSFPIGKDKNENSLYVLGKKYLQKLIKFLDGLN